jgi:hypothetical protein
MSLPLLRQIAANDQGMNAILLCTVQCRGEQSLICVTTTNCLHQSGHCSLKSQAGFSIMPPLRPCSALVVIILVVIQAPQVFSDARCFLRDGSEDYSASPCPSLYNTAMCCWLNRTDGFEPDVCTPQGFCISGQFWGELFLDSCTSGNWEGNSGCSPVPAACGERLTLQ